MDLIPISKGQEYIVCDRDLKIARVSPQVEQYTVQTATTGEDIAGCLPEMFGLETTCQEIFAGNLASFSLEAILRHKAGRELYFSLLIKKVEEHLIIFLSDVTSSAIEQQSSVQRLNEAEITLNKLQRFEYCTNKIIGSMQDVLLITSPKGIIERINKSATELFQRKKSELLDRSIDDLIGDSSYSHQAIYSSLLDTQDAVSKIEVSFTDKEQVKTIQIEFDCFIAPTEVKDFFNCVYIGRDITARKQAETEIRKSLAREKELRELKSGFLSMASHEFRNPLSSILLCVQNLGENSAVDDNNQFYLQSIRDAALTMNSLLEDILVLSKTESDKQTLNLEPIELRAFCQQIVQKLTSIYNQRRINFDYQSERETVNLDSTTLWHILNNLLSNALKYSPDSTVVDLIISDRQNAARAIMIEVRDRGIGIPPESQKHLFESFYRAGNVSSLPGTGLGLTIVKKSVDLYQGVITVDSQIGRGTNIVVELPIDA